VCKVPRAHGFAWEFRYYYTDEKGVRKLKVQTFDPVIYKTSSIKPSELFAKLSRDSWLL
jgi:hypothetical protein